MRARNLVRFIAVAALIVSSSTLLGGPAEAKGKPVTVTLTCTNAVLSATATVTLQASIFGPSASGSLTLDCGTGSVSGLSTNVATLKASSLPAGFVSYSITQSSPVAGGCGGASVRPLTTGCNGGVTLSVS